MKISLIILFVIIFLLLCFLYSLPGYGLKDIVKLPLTIPFLQETTVLMSILTLLFVFAYQKEKII